MHEGGVARGRSVRPHRCKMPQTQMSGGVKSVSRGIRTHNSRVDFVDRCYDTVFVNNGYWSSRDDKDFYKFMCLHVMEYLQLQNFNSQTKSSC